MKKIFITGLLLSFSTIAYATCPLEGGSCAIATDIPIIRERFKPIYSEYDSAADFGGNPFIRLTPTERPELERDFRTKNEMNNETNYDSGCQFGVCLPNDGIRRMQ